MINDVVIIGAGASGLCAAIMLKQKNSSLSVRILEALPRVGKKLAATGNGRCNITNRNITLKNYHGESPLFCEYALNRYGINETESFFENIGVPFVYEGEKAYPASLQAASVVDCMRFAADEAGVITHTETEVTKISVSGGNYKVTAGNVNFIAKNVIVAAGLLSGGDKLGCNGNMLKLLEKAGFGTVKTTPAIVQLKTPPEIVRQLKGIKVNTTVSLKCGGKVLRTEYGETLFCDYGLSGPPILQVSREAARRSSSEISLDLIPNTEYGELCGILSRRAGNLKHRRLDEFFTGMLNKRLGQVVLKLAGLRISDTAAELSAADVKKIASVIKNMSFEVTGTTGFINSQVTAGGLDTKDFDSKTMMSRGNKGFYAIGEILDIDGDCGGFNLQWAWSSAMTAAESILNRQA